jgi:hypothetical protein
MKKFTVLFLAMLFMIAGMTYLISMTGTDKAERQALKQDVLDMKKAWLGSTGMEVTKPDRVARSRGDVRKRSVFNASLWEDEYSDEDLDEDEDGDFPSGLCPCDTWWVSATIAPQESRTFCVKCCANQFIKLDLFSERLGAPTDVTLLVTDGNGFDLYADDDGRGFSGVSTDSCLIFECPEDEEYTVTVSNLTHPAAGFTAEQSVFSLVTDVLCDVEIEPNGPESPQVLYCPELPGPGNGVDDEDEDADEVEDGNDPFDFDDEVGDGDADEAADEDEDEDADGIAGGMVVGTYGGEEGDWDCFDFCLEEGDILFVSLDSAECDDVADMDQVDPVFTLVDEDGNLVAGDDDTEDLDPGLSYRVPEVGIYTLCLYDYREYSPGVYELVWTIEREHSTDDINCTVEDPGGPYDEDEDFDVVDGDPRNL